MLSTYVYFAEQISKFAFRFPRSSPGFADFIETAEKTATFPAADTTPAGILRGAPARPGAPSPGVTQGCLKIPQREHQIRRDRKDMRQREKGNYIKCKFLSKTTGN